MLAQRGLHQLHRRKLKHLFVADEHLWQIWLRRWVVADGGNAREARPLLAPRSILGKRRPTAAPLRDQASALRRVEATAVSSTLMRSTFLCRSTRSSKQFHHCQTRRASAAAGNGHV